MKTLLTAEELAQKLKVSKKTIWKWGQEGILETKRFGRTVRFYWEGEEDEQGSN